MKKKNKAQKELFCCKNVLPKIKHENNVNLILICKANVYYSWLLQYFCKKAFSLMACPLSIVNCGKISYVEK